MLSFHTPSALLPYLIAGCMSWYVYHWNLAPVVAFPWRCRRPTTRFYSFQRFSIEDGWWRIHLTGREKELIINMMSSIKWLVQNNQISIVCYILRQNDVFLNHSSGRIHQVCPCWDTFIFFSSSTADWCSWVL